MTCLLKRKLSAAVGTCHLGVEQPQQSEGFETAEPLLAGSHRLSIECQILTRPISQEWSKGPCPCSKKTPTSFLNFLSELITTSTTTSRQPGDGSLKLNGGPLVTWGRVRGPHQNWGVEVSGRHGITRGGS